MSRPLSLRITDTAEDDLANVWAFIAADSSDRADRFVQEIAAKFEPLRHHPALGTRRERLAAGLRAHFHRGYVIYYRATETELIVVRVLHGARDAAALFTDELE